MSGPRLCSLLLLFLSIMVPSAAAEATRFQLARPGCIDTCGNVTIPFPFGIGTNCAINASYVIICGDLSTNSSNTNSSNTISSKPYLSKLNLEVLHVSLRDQTMTVSTPVSQICPDQEIYNTSWSSPDLSGSPFFFSKVFNRLKLFGCGNALLKLNQKHDNQVLSGCTTMFKVRSNMSGCYAINFCETSIPFYLTDYLLDYEISEFNNSCASAFLADEEWWPPEKFSDLLAKKSLQSVPVVLSWTLPYSDVISISGCRAKEIYLEVGSNLSSSWRCECEFFPFGAYLYGFSPYLDGACQYAVSKFFGKGKKNRIAAIVGASVGVGVLFLMITAFTLYKVVKKRHNKKRKEKFFKRNGGLLLQQQLSADEGAVEKTMLFTAKELNRASDGFNENRILGQGGQGTVYKGMLTDGIIVAIKKSKKVDECQLEQFINEVVILSQVNHRNVVKLLGCCLETEVPLLVYEFIPNGTLFSLIHNDNDDEFPLTWNMRLRIATEVAGALAYLHSAISIPIFHRDIKSSNILLDEKYIAKVSDFGTSMSVAIDKTHLTTLVKGTFGYLDPEYFQSSQFTEKSDVYSFGVVLAELLTSQKPISSTTTEEDGNLSLATRFLISMEENSLKKILDPQVVNQENEKEVIAVAKLAQRCLNLTGKRRPTMKEVAIGLESIKLSSAHSTTQENFPSSSSIEGESTVFSDTNYTWTTESDGFTSVSDVHPLLHSVSVV